jgi:hypothetical protein
MLQSAEPVGLLCPHLEQPDDSVLLNLTQKFESDEFERKA